MIHHAKKSLGQNFLKSEPTLQMMLTAGDVNANDVILEIGPGKGALTSRLLEKAKKVIAIEKDYELIPVLEERFTDAIKNKKLILIHDDILQFDPSELIHYKVIANIPYNITGAILKRFLSEVEQPSVMILLVQKEVAERIVARGNKESILSLSVKAYGTPKYMMKVEKRFFSPSPKVDSAIIAITNISRKNFKTKNEEELFFKIVKSAFAHKRKVLCKNLEGVASTTIINTMFQELQIDKKARAEDLSFPIWLKMKDYLSTKI